MTAAGTGVRILATVEDLAEAAADELLHTAREAIAARSRFTIALSGGSTPQRLYGLLPAAVPAELWSAVQLFWGDERAVPPQDPRSNYGTACEILIAHIDIPPENIHRIRGEETDAARAALLYEEELRREFGLESGEPPRLDLVLLGMGADGHTASLFPGTRAVVETERLVVANRVPRLDTTRITLTLPVLNNAGKVIFLVAGAAKSTMLAQVLEGPIRPRELPAQAVQPHAGELLWLVDAAAAHGLRRRANYRSLSDEGQ